MIPILQALTLLCCFIVYGLYCYIDDKIYDYRRKKEDKKQKEKERKDIEDWQKRHPNPNNEQGTIRYVTIKNL